MSDVADETAAARQSIEQRRLARQRSLSQLQRETTTAYRPQPNFGDQTVMRRARSVAWDVSTAADVEPDPAEPSAHPSSTPLPEFSHARAHAVSAAGATARRVTPLPDARSYRAAHDN